jgi:hypothetical protein
MRESFNLTMIFVGGVASSVTIQQQCLPLYCTELKELPLLDYKFTFFLFTLAEELKLEFKVGEGAY